MKLRHALSLTAFFAGAGLGTAQDAPAKPVAPPAPVVAQPAPVAPRASGAMMTDAVAVTPANLAKPGCAGCGNGNGHGMCDSTVVMPDYRVYGRAEYLLW